MIAMNFSESEQVGETEIYNTILDTVGDTPLVRLHNVATGVACEILAKVEFFNPGGSVKDRVAISIIEDAERHGKLRAGGTIVEATSGNTGVGLAIAAAIKGYKCVFVIPDKQSIEKVKQLRAFGARVIVTPTNVEPDDPRSYYSVAKHIVQETPNAILANQYHNPANPETHYRFTGPEIWQQVRGKIDVFVAGMGTGGTISGVGRYLKERNPDVQIVAVDPEGSILAEYFRTGKFTDAHSYKVEGIGEDFIPSVLDFSVTDDIVTVTDKESFLMARRLVREEGIFCGGSSGSAMAGAIKYAVEKQLGSNKRVVVLLPDSGSRYLGKIFDDTWMRENGFLPSNAADVRIKDVLAVKRQHALVTTPNTSTLSEVIAQMKAHDVSQLPVVNERGQLVGLVTEVSLLKRLLDSQPDAVSNQAINDVDVIEPKVMTITPDTSLEEVAGTFATASVAVVVDASESHPTDILTKIDLLSYLASSQN